MSDINKINAQEQALNLLAQADGSLENIFRNDPKLLSLLQQGGQSIENQVATVLIAKYPAQFGSLTQGQVVALINNFAEANQQLNAANAALNTAEAAVVPTANALVSAINAALPPGGFTALINEANSPREELPVSVSTDLQNVSTYASIVQTDLSQNASANTIANDTYNLTASLSGLATDTSATLAFGVQLPLTSAFESAIGVSTNPTSGPYYNALNASANFSNVLVVQLQAQALVTQLEQQFSGLNPLEMQLVNELPGIV